MSTSHHRLAPARTAAVLVMSLWLTTARPLAQLPSLSTLPSPADASPLSSAESAFLRSLELGEMPARISGGLKPSSRAPHLRLFRIAPGFLTDPLGMQDSSNPIPGVPTLGAEAMAEPADDGPDWLEFGMGADNPYLDMRRPGDPGGVGFYRVNTQVQLLDSATTSCALSLQAVTPAGIQYAGAADGATVVSPSLSVFHALSQGTAIQGFVSKNVPISNADGSAPLQRNLQCGMAVQRPLLADGPDSLRGLILSVGALGQLRPDSDGVRLMPACDLLPGLHWHLNDNWWVSSGVLVPVGPTHLAPSQFQFTCSFRY